MHDKYHIVIQLAAHQAKVPPNSMLRKWAIAALHERIDSAEITIRIVKSKEMSELNSIYRHKKGPTNVLSFPFVTQESVEIEIPILGDIVICAAVVNREAKAQKKSRHAHWSHMVVHGILHLLGYDHHKKREAIIMENLEKKILHQLGFKNPYGLDEININD